MGGEFHSTGSLHPSGSGGSSWPKVPILVGSSGPVHNSKDASSGILFFLDSSMVFIGCPRVDLAGVFWTVAGYLFRWGICLITDADLNRALALVPDTVRQVELVKTVCLAVVALRDAKSAGKVFVDWAAVEKRRPVRERGARLKCGLAAPYWETLSWSFSEWLLGCWVCYQIPGPVSTWQWDVIRCLSEGFWYAPEWPARRSLNLIQSRVN